MANTKKKKDLNSVLTELGVRVGTSVTISNDAHIFPGESGTLQEVGVDGGVVRGKVFGIWYSADDIVLSDAKRTQKYATGVWIDGFYFKSPGEGRRYEFLRDAQERGIIRDLVLQPEFELTPKFHASNATVIDSFGIHSGYKCNHITYKADFSYVMVATGEAWVEDRKAKQSNGKKKGKAFITKDSSVAIRHFLYLNPNIKFAINTKADWLPS